MKAVTALSRMAAALLALTLASCQSATDIDPVGTPLEIALVDGPEVKPAMVNGICVIFMRLIDPVAARSYWADPALTTLQHLGKSAYECLDGRAAPYLSEVPPAFFRSMMWVDLDGSCPGTASGCYYHLNPRLDNEMIQQKFAGSPVPLTFLEGLLGHEIYHGVAGHYHD